MCILKQKVDLPAHEDVVSAKSRAMNAMTAKKWQHSSYH